MFQYYYNTDITVYTCVIEGALGASLGWPPTTLCTCLRFGA